MKFLGGEITTTTSQKLELFELIRLWFKEPYYDLSELYYDEKIKKLLIEFQEFCFKTGATSITLANYLYSLEQQIKEFKQQIQELKKMKKKNDWNITRIRWLAFLDWVTGKLKAIFSRYP